MKMNSIGTNKMPWGAIFGFSAVGLYTTLTIIAITQYPGTVSPLDTYLSQLGNADINPDGALFYNLAVILGGLSEILFFIAISIKFSNGKPLWLWRIAVLAGMINGVAVLMSGVFAEHVNMEAHTSWSYLIFLSLIPMLLAFSLTFWGMPEFSTGISLYGFVVCAIDILFLITILGGGLGPGVGSFMEWFAVFTYLIWVSLVSLAILKLSRIESPT